MENDTEKPWSRKPLLIIPALIAGLIGYWVYSHRDDVLRKESFKDDSLHRMVALRKGFASSGWKELCFYKDKYQPETAIGTFFASVTAPRPMFLSIPTNNSMESSLVRPNLSDCSLGQAVATVPRDGGDAYVAADFTLWTLRDASHAVRQVKLIRHADSNTVLDLMPPEELRGSTNGELSGYDVPFISDDGAELTWSNLMSSRYLMENVLDGSKTWVDEAGKVSEIYSSLASIRPHVIIFSGDDSISGYDRQLNRIWGPVKIELTRAYGSPRDLKVIGDGRPPQVVAWNRFIEEGKGYGPYKIMSIRNGQVTRITGKAHYSISDSDVSADGKLMIVAAEELDGIGGDPLASMCLIFIYDLESGKEIFRQPLAGYTNPKVAFWANDIVAVSISKDKLNGGTAVFQKIH